MECHIKNVFSFEFSKIQRHSVMNYRDLFLTYEKNSTPRMILQCVLSLCYVKSSDKNSSCEWILDLLKT